MALFSRKNRPDDPDTVHLASADHSWWTGETGPAEHGGVGPDLDGADTGPAPDVAARIADALEEYGYGPAAAGTSLPGPTGPGPASAGPGSPTEAAPHAHGGPGPDTTCFVRDGLPAEDRLAELLGALGLEGDADWVDIARAHRRLTTPTPGRADGEDECQRRAVNEAYACLRLFHH